MATTIDKLKDKAEVDTTDSTQHENTTHHISIKESERADDQKQQKRQVYLYILKL